MKVYIVVSTRQTSPIMLPAKILGVYSNEGAANECVRTKQQTPDGPTLTAAYLTIEEVEVQDVF